MRCRNCNRELSLGFFKVFKFIKKKMTLRDEIYNLTIGQMEILHFIKDKKQVPMKEVADFLEITPPSATSLINNLVISDILERKFDKIDRRVILLNITEKGKKIFEKAKKERAEAFEKIISILTEEERNHLLKILKKIQNQY
ncbi:MAG: MarR family transcriptional regulator [Candidatus Pacebacteria bacterium]|nr:MarR family transcriptional regulator [Candidatus Paceibacterota bacterium]